MPGFLGGFLIPEPVYWGTEIAVQEAFAMSLGSSLFHARKKSGLTQEDVAALEALLEKGGR